MTCSFSSVTSGPCSTLTLRLSRNSQYSTVYSTERSPAGGHLTQPVVCLARVEAAVPARHGGDHVPEGGGHVPPAAGPAHRGYARVRVNLGVT